MQLIWSEWNILWTQPDQLIQVIYFIIDVMEGRGGGGNRYLSNVFYKKTVIEIPHTGLKCLIANFIYYATHLPGGGGIFDLFINFFMMIYTFKLLQSFPSKHHSNKRLDSLTAGGGGGGGKLINHFAR